MEMTVSVQCRKWALDRAPSVGLVAGNHRRRKRPLLYSLSRTLIVILRQATS